jgi:3-phenylpropionate/trans-cinnamate dioxygenase ferredoxin subunit
VARYAVCRTEDLPSGSRRIVEVGGRSIGVFNVDGRHYAVRNVCPHMGAPLCLGLVGGTMLPSAPHTYQYGLHNRIIRCPWHGYEFDLETGRPPFDTYPLRVRTYRVVVEGGRVVVEA